jgi:hypothetical protein
MPTFDPATFAPAIAELLHERRLAPLDGGQPNRAVRARLEALADDRAFAPHRVRDRAMATACRAGLWLYHDYLDEAHALSQDLHTTNGSYWHALMHRREPDFGNSKYWFRQVGDHPVYESLRQAAADLAENAPPRGAFFLRQAAWDPFAFVDLCEASFDLKADCHDLCRQVQRLEWELLFAYCYEQAVGGR